MYNSSFYLEVHESLVEPSESLLGVDDVVVAGGVGHEDHGGHVGRVRRPLRPRLAHVHLKGREIGRMGYLMLAKMKVNGSFFSDWTVSLTVLSLGNRLTFPPVADGSFLGLYYRFN